MSKPTTKTFSIHLNKKQAAIVSITVTGSIDDTLGDQIEILDSRGYLIGRLHLAMDTTKREILHTTP